MSKKFKPAEILKNLKEARSSGEGSFGHVLKNALPSGLQLPPQVEAKAQPVGATPARPFHSASELLAWENRLRDRASQLESDRSEITRQRQAFQQAQRDFAEQQAALANSQAIHAEQLLRLSQFENDRAQFQADLERLADLDSLQAKVIRDEARLAVEYETLAALKEDLRQRALRQSKEERLLEKMKLELEALPESYAAMEKTLKSVQKKLRRLEPRYEAMQGQVQAVEARLERVTTEKNLEIKRLKGLAIVPVQLKVQAKAELGWDLPLIEKALGGNLPKNFPLPDAVATLGSRPWPESALNDVLSNLGLDVYGIPDADMEVLVIGREQWTEAELLAQIEARDGETLRVYDQDLFLLGLLQGEDPLRTWGTKRLKEWGEQHPALKFLMSLKWPWPAVSIGNGPGDADLDMNLILAEKSPLCLLGYRAGKTQNQKDAFRRTILRLAMERELPWTESDAYMASWGEPNHWRRLQRLALHLARLINKQGRGSRMAVARAHWVSDLAWLKEQYYAKYSKRVTWPRF